MIVKSCDVAGFVVVASKRLRLREAFFPLFQCRNTSPGWKNAAGDDDATQHFVNERQLKELKTKRFQKKKLVNNCCLKAVSIRYSNKRQKPSEIHDGGKWNAVGQVVNGIDR